MTKLQHEEVIKHMAEHGYESVQYMRYAFTDDSSIKWGTGSDCKNPITYPEYKWRIKPPTIKIKACELPAPVGLPNENERFFEFYHVNYARCVDHYSWTNDQHQIDLINTGFCFADKESAEHFAAWLKKTFTANDPDQKEKAR